jgi:hypothetical protein
MGTPKPVKYVERFVQRLNADYRFDEACVRIAANKEFAEYCATMVRRYNDSAFTDKLYAERKAWLSAYREDLTKAIEGFEAGTRIYREREPATAGFLQAKAAELQGVLPGADDLLDVKQHGRYRDHGILYCMRLEMEKILGPVTNETLANVINAAQELDDHAAEPVDADTIRKNLANFLERNPNWDLSQGNSNP